MPRKSSSSSTIRRRSTTRIGKRTIRRRTTNSTTRGKWSSRRGTNSSSGGGGSSSSSALSARTRKAIDTLPSHAQKIYSKAHKNALKQYASPSKRRGGKGQSKEQVAHRVAWSAVKKEYKKKGYKWVPKKD
ncbi:MAG: putative ChaB family protein [Nitrososphaera sp.]|nr:putative ChaB family protein [Nitrososphaera sp.]